MKTKYFIILTILLLATSFFFTQDSTVKALSVSADIQYPVDELGGCESEEACKEYCNQKSNMDRCLDFAEKHGLMTSQEIEGARKFLSGEIKGPGGCKTKEECMEYCNDIDKMDQCVAFAEENNLLPPSELQEFKQIQSAIDGGLEPLPCKNKKDCELYCEDPSNMRKCIEFGKGAGFLKGKELKDAEKMIAAIERGVTAPPCRGRESCEEYCSAPEHMEMCLDFALEAGFMDEKEAHEARKMLNAIKSGVKPLGCRGREECDRYCKEENHMEECIGFAEAAGFMSKEEAEMARKTGGMGPGGCSGKEECESFCENPDNRETCLNFAKEHGLISEENMGRMEEGLNEMQQMPTEARACLEAKLGADFATRMQKGELSRDEMEAVVRGCMGGASENHLDGQGSMPVPQSGAYPCQTPEECEKLKQDMMNQQSGMPAPATDVTPAPTTSITPEEYQKQYEEQNRDQYEEQKRQMEEQFRLQQQLQEQYKEQPVPTSEPTGFLSNTILGALIYSLFQLFSGK